MKFTWKYDYVPVGQIEPDQHNRWAINCYISVHIDKALPQYSKMKPYIESEYMNVQIAQINQKGTEPGNVPSTVSKFAARCPSFDDAGNTGFATQHYFFSDDIEELKKIVESQFEKIQLVFQNCQ
jgi:hypothetical protein